MRALVWFRRDLRTRDHTALFEACRAADDGVAAAYVICRDEWRRHDDAKVKIEFWLRHLRILWHSLSALNIHLHVVHAGKPSVAPGRLLAIAQRQGCEALYFNHEYEVDESTLEEAVERLFRAKGLAVRGFHDHVLLDPTCMRTSAGRAYRVFTPFRKEALRRIAEERIRVLPAPPPQKPIPQLGRLVRGAPDITKAYQSGIPPELWPAGEEQAHRRLDAFCNVAIGSYRDHRNIPALEGTSRLSPYLTAGVLSPRQCLLAARDANAGRLDDRRPGAPGPALWITQLLWREFFIHILAGFPRVSMHRAFKPATDRIRWNNNPRHFRAWRQGRTGVPIVDAAMRQLSATGWMHNRLRMIVAMFLTKDLFLDWRLGERHFMRHLIDGDLASNNGGWQWCAGTGADAAPYFRIFNPIAQSRRIDPDGTFIRTWVPELRLLDDDAIHAPYESRAAPPKGLDYPRPIISRQGVRDRVIEAFRNAPRTP